MAKIDDGAGRTEPAIRPPPFRAQPPRRRAAERNRLHPLIIGGVCLGLLAACGVIWLMVAQARDERHVEGRVRVGAATSDMPSVAVAPGDLPATVPAKDTSRSDASSDDADQEAIGDQPTLHNPAVNADDPLHAASPLEIAPDSPDAGRGEQDGTPQADSGRDSSSEHEPADATQPAPRERTESQALRSFQAFSAPALGEERTPIKDALAGRKAEARTELLARYGGGEDTEKAVLLALEWLARNQHEDGSWSLQGPYSGGGHIQSPVAATAMALMAFEGAGNTPAAGRFQDHVRRGVHALTKMQDKTGRFAGSGRQSGQLYAQAQATIALCELYGMTKSRSYRQPAQLAIDYAAHFQSAQGGWRYEPGSDADTSVTGWFVMALQSGLMAELDVPPESFQRVASFLDSVSSSDGSRYAYHGNGATNPSHAMTAEALLCRQYLGWGRRDERLNNGISYLDTIALDWNQRNVYCWYYATQVMHNMEGAVWRRWNGALKPVLLENQVVTGPEAGSWDHLGDPHGQTAGRLYTTCLCVWMLETYYRHLPIYSYRVL